MLASICDAAAPQLSRKDTSVVVGQLPKVKVKVLNTTSWSPKGRRSKENT